MNSLQARGLLIDDLQPDIHMLQIFEISLSPNSSATATNSDKLLHSDIFTIGQNKKSLEVLDVQPTIETTQSSAKSGAWAANVYFEGFSRCSNRSVQRPSQPPSTASTVPWTNREASLARNTTGSAISSGRPHRAAGTRANRATSRSGSFCRAAVLSVAT